MNLKKWVPGAILAVAGAMVAALVAFAAPQASAASLTQVTNFGTNPTNLQMHLYVPDRVAAKPGILLAIHYCGGSGPGFHSQTQYASLADRYGFVVIYPTVTRSSKCWDVSSAAALRRGGGSDPVGLMAMVDYVKQRHNADPGRIFATGTSSGAMMTNVLLGVYPDVFNAGASFAGVPFACFATTNGSEWNSQCSSGQSIKTPQQWGDLVRAAYPGYTGPRPRMQIWHGTNDDTLRYPNFGEQVKQWTNVHGLSQTPTFTDTPQSGYTRTRYGSTGGMAPVEAISMQGVTHNIPVDAAQVIRFFGLDGTPPTSTTTTTTTSTTTTTTTTPQPGDGCRVAYTVSAWNTGLTASITVTNTGSTAVNGWSLAFTLPGGQTITSGWSATYAPTTGAVTARNVSYNTAIAPGTSVTLGFQANHTGNTGEPSSFTLNGAACAVA
ncbi:extracellular catalytic domain type 1 short-chain-length polyhydroxyalkanoate depolymerase [Saccharothrix luteola]|uniref:extracellular catalytic domain type 1 short-chain-length polyhydroxyalkanoate depolymerase n=1 Tax=Saccharothrix luteola TaxID=2893018 RepID=UPI001E568502|nr:PHB depolymerase family esterase [Saccharothrix luteola]MCC8247118.1 PHB depolymerase family esterase [Saccharothrix luteola]MCC8249841.1 PHB depolymerase family esterase [Saccharothrix luteola]